MCRIKDEQRLNLESIQTYSFVFFKVMLTYYCGAQRGIFLYFMTIGGNFDLHTPLVEQAAQAGGPQGLKASSGVSNVVVLPCRLPNREIIASAD